MSVRSLYWPFTEALLRKELIIEVLPTLALPMKITFEVFLVCNSVEAITPLFLLFWVANIRKLVKDRTIELTSSWCIWLLLCGSVGADIAHIGSGVLLGIAGAHL